MDYYYDAADKIVKNNAFFISSHHMFRPIQQQEDYTNIRLVEVLRQYADHQFIYGQGFYGGYRVTANIPTNEEEAVWIGCAVFSEEAAMGLH